MIVSAALSALCDLVLPIKPDIIAGIGACGFLFALPLARMLGSRAMVVRKAGKLPSEVLE